MSTKIIATIGPSSESYKKMELLAKSGVNFFRVNFSHATYPQYRRIKSNLAKINKNKKNKISLIQDLQGPRIRLGNLLKDSIVIKKGDKLNFKYFTNNTEKNDILPIDSSSLYRFLKAQDLIYLANGEMELEVLKIEKKIIYTKVIKGGVLTSQRGVNLPNTDFKEAGLTAKDILDVNFAVKEGVDYIALSFVQRASDIEKLRKLINNPKISIIAKIERRLALDNIDKIIQAADAIMVARGDLGIEVPMEELPIIQKHLVRHAHWHDKPAIIATQVMTSMINSAHPTRAEVSDIANAVLDGADMIMLSDETAIGKYPSLAIEYLNKTVSRTNKYLYKDNVTKY
jgi:pyruvate kinase